MKWYFTSILYLKDTGSFKIKNRPIKGDLAAATASQHSLCLVLAWINTWFSVTQVKWQNIWVNIVEGRVCFIIKWKTMVARRSTREGGSRPELLTELNAPVKGTHSSVRQRSRMKDQAEGTLSREDSIHTQLLLTCSTCRKAWELDVDKFWHYWNSLGYILFSSEFVEGSGEKRWPRLKGVSFQVKDMHSPSDIMKSQSWESSRPAIKHRQNSASWLCRVCVLSKSLSLALYQLSPIQSVC